jgi:hypothetical protein
MATKNPSPHSIPREEKAFRFSQESLGVTGKTVKVIQKKTGLVKKKRLSAKNDRNSYPGKQLFKNSSKSSW